MLHLHELTLEHAWLLYGIPSDNVVQDIRQNASLHKLVMDQRSFTERECRLMNAYCERNRLASSILLGSIKEATETMPTDGARLLLVPFVFRAIQPIQQKSVSTFLTGLLVCDELIGPGTDGKRANR